MKKISVIIILTMMTSVSCNQLPSDPMMWNEEQLNKWFSEASWQQGWTVKPHSLTNKRSFAVHYLKNRDRWDKAFAFMKNTDLLSLEKGKVELDGPNLYYTIDSYMTKNMEETRYEAHQKYIDIQYVFEGEELIGVTTADRSTLTEPYNPERDVAFYESDGGSYAKAAPSEYLIFFPEDLHRPCLKSGDNALVRKLVIKVKVD